MSTIFLHIFSPNIIQKILFCFQNSIKIKPANQFRNLTTICYPNIMVNFSCQVKPILIVKLVFIHVTNQHFRECSSLNQFNKPAQKNTINQPSVSSINKIFLNFFHTIILKIIFYRYIF